MGCSYWTKTSEESGFSQILLMATEWWNQLYGFCLHKF